MRISDWSSDVCSSDLVFGERAVAVHADADGVRAQVLLAGAAVAAVAADDMALGRNPLADRVAAYAGSDLDDAADEFMAHHQPGLARSLAPPDPQAVARASCGERVCQSV